MTNHYTITKILLGRILNRFSKDVEFLDDRLVIMSIEYLTVSEIALCIAVGCIVIFRFSLVSLLQWSQHL